MKHTEALAEALKLTNCSALQNKLQTGFFFKNLIKLSSRTKTLLFLHRIAKIPPAPAG